MRHNQSSSNEEENVPPQTSELQQIEAEDSEEEIIATIDVDLSEEDASSLIPGIMVRAHEISLVAAILHFAGACLALAAAVLHLMVAK